MDVDHSTFEDDSSVDDVTAISPEEAAERNRILVEEFRDLRAHGEYSANAVQEAYDAHRFQLTDEACVQVEKRIARLRASESPGANPLQSV